MNLRELVQALRGAWRSIALTALLAGAFAFLGGLFLVRYEAKGSVTVHPLGAQTEDSLAVPVVGMVYAPELSILQNQGQSYLGILTSRILVEDVVDRLGLEARYAKGAQGRAGRLLEAVKQPIRLVLYGRLPTHKPTPRDRAIEKTQRAVSVSLVPSSNIIQVSARHRHGAVARDIVNTLVEAFVTFGQQRGQEEADRAVAFIRLQLEAARAQQGALREAQQETNEQAGLLSFDDLVQRMTQRQQKLEDVEDLLEEHDDRQPALAEELRVLGERLSEVPDYERLSYALARNPVLERIQQDILNLQVELKTLEADYQPGSAPVAVRRRQMDILEAAAEAETDRVLQNEAFEVDPRRRTLLADQAALLREQRLAPLARQVLVDRLGRYRARLAELESLHARVAEVQRALKVLEQREEDLVLSVRRAEAAASRIANEVRVLDRAPLPRYPSFKGTPLLGFVLLAVAGAGVIACAVVVYRA